MADEVEVKKGKKEDTNSQLRDRVRVLEDYLASIQDDLKLASIRLDVVSVARRFNGHHMACRELLGERGEEIESKRRGLWTNG